MKKRTVPFTWDDWVTYPTAYDAPEIVSWLIPSIQPNSVVSYNIQAKVKWGLAGHTPVNSRMDLYHYDPNYNQQ